MRAEKSNSKSGGKIQWKRAEKSNYETERVTTKPKACEPRKSKTGKIKEDMVQFQGNVLASIHSQGASTGS